jgi:hypothetical protein
MNISVRATFLSSLATVLSHQPRIAHGGWLQRWRSDNSRVVNLRLRRSKGLSSRAQN